ncbi:MAG: DUF1080 domain-containing protein [Myxococcales bacterium]
MALRSRSQRDRSAIVAFLICAAGLGSCLPACSASEPEAVAVGGQPAAGAHPTAGNAALSAGGAANQGGALPIVAGAGPAGADNGGAGAGSIAGNGAAEPPGGAGGSIPVAGASSGGAGATSSAGAAAVDLFNGTDLTGFNVYRQNAEKAPGTLLTGAQATAVFKPENGMIHVYADAPDQSTQVHYTLVTVKSYSKYNLYWEYKWGTKKFAPYTDLTKYPRDAGVLWHLHGDITQLWPSSIEFQNKLGSTGDVFALYARCTSPGAPGNTAIFAEGGAPVLVDGSNGFVQHGRSANFEVADGWTPLILQVNADSAVYTVNGHVVNRVSKVTTANGAAVTSGPIAWQAEQAEVFYRNLRIEVLP